jgi:hypothetical protein
MRFAELLDEPAERHPIVDLTVLNHVCRPSTTSSELVDVLGAPDEVGCRRLLALLNLKGGSDA